MSVTSLGAGTTLAGARTVTDDMGAIDSWWRAVNYLTAAQIHLKANALLRHPVAAEHITTR